MKTIFCFFNFILAFAAIGSTDHSNQPFDFQKENKYLKMTISALRDQMEKIELVQAEKIQKTKMLTKQNLWGIFKIEIMFFNKISISLNFHEPKL